jgi:CBS domain-containing protein
MNVSEIMSRKVEIISPETPIRDAAQKMKAYDVGFLPVGDNDRLVGTVTDRDMVIRVIAEGKDAEYCKTRDVMTSDVFWCYEDQTVDEVADYMAEKEVRRVLILNRAKRLVGVVSIGDLAKTGGEQQKTGELIKEIAEAPPSRIA